LKRLNELTELHSQSSLFTQKNLVTAWGAKPHGTPSSKENVRFETLKLCAMSGHVAALVD